MEVASLPATLSSFFVAAEHGDAAAHQALFGRLYADLHRLAQRELARRGAFASIGVTTLLHEAYLDMAASEGPTFPDRPRFMAYTARVMRGLIIDHARSRRASKRGGEFEITSMNTDVRENLPDVRVLTEVGDALDELVQVDAALAEVVDLKFFCGFSFAEIAAMRGVSERTVQRQWEKARIFLHQSLRSDPPL
jgi:RNA polymerase sigma factor (TIGR02999 family)